jgi:Na+/proline symporter
MTVFQWIAIISSAIYLFFLFSLAFFVERSKKMSYIVKNNSTIYALSLCIYCSAWTFYGSIGMASQQGIQFLPIYLGPTLIMPLWFIVTKKAARITKIQNFTTFADFISARYSNSINLGMFITLLSIIGIVPYISLQIKAIFESFMLLIQTEHLSSSNTTKFIPFLIVLIMGVFINIFASKIMDSK